MLQLLLKLTGMTICLFGIVQQQGQQEFMRVLASANWRQPPLLSRHLLLPRGMQQLFLGFHQHLLIYNTGQQELMLAWRVQAANWLQHPPCLGTISFQEECSNFSLGSTNTSWLVEWTLGIIQVLQKLLIFNYTKTCVVLPVSGNGLWAHLLAIPVTSY